MKSTGEKLRTVGKVLGTLTAIAMIILGILQLVAFGKMAKYGGAGALLLTGLVYIALGIFLGWFQNLCFTAFGDLVDDVASVKYRTQKIEELLAHANAVQVSSQTNPSAAPRRAAGPVSLVNAAQYAGAQMPVTVEQTELPTNSAWGTCELCGKETAVHNILVRDARGDRYTCKMCRTCYMNNTK